MKVLKKLVRHIIKTQIFLAAILLLLTEFTGAGIVEQASEIQLNNGLKVILLPNRKSPVATFQVWYHAGSRKDPWGKSGLAHLFEHLMFKGTHRVTGEAFTRTIEVNGGNYNAFTSYDFAGYYENLTGGRIHIAIELEADRMQNLSFTEADFNMEKKVVMEERRLRTEDDPKACLMEEIAAAAFRAQPYHWPVIGWMDDLNRISVEDARDHYEMHYHPGNAFIVVVGQFEKDNLVREIEGAFGEIPPGPEPEHYKYQDPEGEGERRVYLRKTARLPVLVMGYQVPGLGHPDAYVLEVISSLLSNGKSSRLYEHLVRQKALVVSANSYNPLLSMDPDLFMVSAELLPGKNIQEVEEALNEEVQALQEIWVEEQELEKVKNQLEAAFVFEQDSLFRQAMLLARFEIAGGWKEIDTYVPSVRAVTPDDVRRISARYLVPGNRTVGVLIPDGYEYGNGDCRQEP